MSETRWGQGNDYKMNHVQAERQQMSETRWGQGKKLKIRNMYIVQVQGLQVSETYLYSVVAPAIG